MSLVVTTSTKQPFCRKEIWAGSRCRVQSRFCNCLFSGTLSTPDLLSTRLKLCYTATVPCRAWGGSRSRSRHGSSSGGWFLHLSSRARRRSSTQVADGVAFVAHVENLILGWSWRPFSPTLDKSWHRGACLVQRQSSYYATGAAVQR